MPQFSIDQKDFPSATHMSIWHCAVFMAPFTEVIPSRLAPQDARALAEGEKSLYRFMTGLYADMYDNPAGYKLPVGEYDSFLEESREESFHKSAKAKESKLRNRFQKAIQLYQKALFEIGTQGRRDPAAGTLAVDKTPLWEGVRKHNLRVQPDELKDCLLILSDRGLPFTERNGELVFSSAGYPHMLTALHYLCKTGTRKQALTSFLRCDFRGMSPSFALGFADVASVLPGEDQEAAGMLDRYMEDMRCKVFIEPLKNTTFQSRYKVIYKRSGKPLLSLEIDTSRLRIHAYFNHYENLSKMGYLLKEQSEPLYEWFFDRIPSTVCACANNKNVDIGGVKKRVCGLMNRMDVHQSDDASLDNIRQVLDLYVARVSQ